MQDTDIAEPSDKETELERVTALRGFRFGLHDFLAEYDLDQLKRLNDNREAEYLRDSLLDRRTKELVILAACIGMNDSIEHMRLHMHGAVEAGATAEEVLEAIDLIGYWVGAIRRTQAIEGWRRTFRPDLPEIDRVTELRSQGQE